jgi:hypothetical protein
MESRPWNRSLSTARADDKEFVPGSYKRRAMAAQKLSLKNPNHFGTPAATHTNVRCYTLASMSGASMSGASMSGGKLKMPDGHARTWWRAILQYTANTSSGARGACASAMHALRIQDRIRR